MSKGSYYPRAPYNAPSEPVSRLEIDESGPHWQTVRDIRYKLPQGVHRFKSKREVAMAVLLWELREQYNEWIYGCFPDHYDAAQRAEWFAQQKRMMVIVARIDECLTMNI